MRNTGLIIGVVLIIVLLVLLFGGMGMMGFGGFGMGPGMMGSNGMHGFSGTFGFSPFGWIVPLAFWGLLLGGIVLVVVSLARNSRTSSSAASLPIAQSFGNPNNESPLDILKARYARGEITKEQYAEIKKDLEA